MRALSIHQPFAWAIASGFKRVENRSWTTNYRGPVAIHASLNRGRLSDLQTHLGLRFDASLFALGAVVGIADLQDVQSLNLSLEADPWAEGPFCWLFGNSRRLPNPVPARGKTSLFKLTAEESRMVLEQPPAESLDEADYADLLTASRCDPYELYLVRANIYLDVQQVDDAMRCTSRAIEIDSSLEAGWRIRAVTLLDAGRHEEAIRDANEAVTREIGVAGNATITSINKCCEITDGPGSVVIGRFVTRQATNLTEVILANGTRFTGTTTHPVWIPATKQWVKLADLELGQQLDTLLGPITVVAVTRLANTSDVFNIEVHGHHVYRITDDGVLVHNNCLADAIARGMRYLRGPGAPDRMVDVMKKMGRPMSRIEIGNVIHKVKSSGKIGAAEDLVFDHSGGLWDSRTGEYLDKIWEW